LVRLGRLKHRLDQRLALFRRHAAESALLQGPIQRATERTLCRSLDRARIYPTVGFANDKRALPREVALLFLARDRPRRLHILARPLRDLLQCGSV